MGLQAGCINKQAIEKKDYLVCNKILDLEHYGPITDLEIALCVREVAIATNNPFLCVKINNQNEKNVCYQKLAVNLKDYFLCDYMTIVADDDSFYKDSCYWTIGVNEKKLAACKKIQNTALKENCTRNN